jgi:hypothetical protein
MTSHLDSDFLSRLRSSVGSASAAPPTPESINSSFNSASKKNNDSYVVNEMSFTSYKQKLHHGNVNSKHQDEYGGMKTPSRTDSTTPTVGLTPQVQSPLPYSPVETDSPFINNSANQDAQYATKFTPKSKKGYIISPSLFSPTSPIMPSSSSSSSSSQRAKTYSSNDNVGGGGGGVKVGGGMMSSKRRGAAERRKYIDHIQEAEETYFEFEL